MHGIPFHGEEHGHDEHHGDDDHETMDEDEHEGEEMMSMKVKEYLL